MEKSYIIFLGTTKDNVFPIQAVEDKQEAIDIAQELLKRTFGTHAEVVYMPENDIDTNEVVWTNRGNYGR